MSLGRLFWQVEYTLDINTFAHRLRKLIKRNELDNHFTVYLFGSFLKSKKFLDIDILIIYSNTERLLLLKKMINEEFYNELIHLTCLTGNEEKELNFINSTSAKNLNEI